MMFSSYVTLVSKPTNHWHWEPKDRRQTSQSGDVKGVFSTEAIFGWNQCFRGAAARLHLLSRDCMQPSLLVLRLLLGRPPIFQLMKCVENQELDEGLFQSSSTKTKQGEMKTNQCAQAVVRDWRHAARSVSDRQTLAIELFYVLESLNAV